MEFPDFNLEDDDVTPRGNLKIFDFDHPEAGAQAISIENDMLNHDSFNPHGISVWTDNTTSEMFLKTK